MQTKLFLCILGFIILPYCITPLSGMCAEREQVVVYDGLKLQGRLENGKTFQVNISLRQDSYDGKINPSLGFVKPRLIDEFKMTIDGKETIIPREAISDLADIILPEGCYFKQTTETVILYVKGGDGEGAYTVSLELNIKNNNLISKTIEFINQEGELDKKTTKYNLKP